MSRRDVLVAAAPTFAAMLLYGLYASERRVCFDSPCGTTGNIVHFMVDEAWLIALLAFPLSLLAVRARHRPTGRPG